MMLTDEEKDQIADRQVTVSLTLGEAGAVGVAIGQCMQRIEDGTFTSLVPLNLKSLYDGMHLFARRLQVEVMKQLSEHEAQDMRDFQKTVSAKAQGRPQ